MVLSNIAELQNFTCYKPDTPFSPVRKQMSTLFPILWCGCLGFIEGARAWQAFS
jgi:hypothetical protein